MAEFDEELLKFARIIARKERCEEIFNLDISMECCSKDIFNARTEIDSVLDMLREGDEASKCEAISKLESLRSSLYPPIPQKLRNFRTGWMDNPKDKTNIRNRRSEFGSILRRAGEFLADGIEAEDLPENGCIANCDCPLRHSIIGDRGGTPRRVPCQLLERKGWKKFERREIIMVNIFFSIN